MTNPDYKPDMTEYLYIGCNVCGERAKLARDKGAGYWKTFDFLPEFLLEHYACGVDNIRLEWE